MKVKLATTLTIAALFAGACGRDPEQPAGGALAGAPAKGPAAEEGGGPPEGPAIDLAGALADPAPEPADGRPPAPEPEGPFELVTVTAEHENGLPQTERQEKLYANGARVRHGPIRVWHDNGQKLLEGQYRDGVIDGWWVYWHSTGALQREGMYRDGQMEDWWVFWYDNGQKQMEGLFVAGRQEGPWLGWWPDGKPRFEGEYVEGRREGPWLVWDEDGEPNAGETGTYKNGARMP